MKGLLIKDYQLLKTQKNFILVIIAMTAFFLFMKYDSTFIVSYISFLSSMLVLTTISYDEYNHGLSFLLTLPVTRKVYVQSKYLFGILLGIIGWLIGIIISAGYNILMAIETPWIEWFATCALLAIILLLLLTIMIPTQLKFGGDKGRIALIGVIVAIFFVGYVIVNGLSIIDIDVIAIFYSLFTLNLAITLMILFVITGICMYISYQISNQIIHNKEL